MFSVVVFSVVAVTSSFFVSSTAVSVVLIDFTDSTLPFFSGFSVTSAANTATGSFEVGGAFPPGAVSGRSFFDLALLDRLELELLELELLLDFAESFLFFLSSFTSSALGWLCCSIRGGGDSLFTSPLRTGAFCCGATASCDDPQPISNTLKHKNTD